MWWTLSSPALLFAATVSVIRSDSPQSLQVSDDFHSENWPHKILIPTQFQFQFHLNRSFVAHIPHSQRDSFKWLFYLTSLFYKEGTSILETWFPWHVREIYNSPSQFVSISREMLICSITIETKCRARKQVEASCGEGACPCSECIFIHYITFVNCCAT